MIRMVTNAYPALLCLCGHADRRAGLFGATRRRNVCPVVSLFDFIWRRFVLDFSQFKIFRADARTLTITPLRGDRQS